MGHIRLGNLPRTRQFQQVVALLDSGAGTPQIAAATLEAAKRGLEQAARDPALVHSFWLLSQLPLCARAEDFVAALNKVGITVTSTPTLLELVGGFADAIDDHVRMTGGRTDLGEMAQMGAAESVAALLRERTPSMFGTTPDMVRNELAALATKKQFSTLARDFFSRLTERYLAYFLSHRTSSQFRSVPDNRQFRGLSTFPFGFKKGKYLTANTPSALAPSAAALAAVVARSFGLRRIRFYENGVVSMNLPISEQAIGGRATRTTHPQVLNGYAALFRLLTDGAFEVENPFLWLTKGLSGNN